MNAIESFLHLLATLPPAYPIIIGVVLLIIIASIPKRRFSYRYRKYPYTRYPQRARPYVQHQESPAEAAFNRAWIARRNHIKLEQEYEVGIYRIDFAHPQTKTAVEIDGMLGHSSPDDISKDRARQREIERRGWHFIRFGAKEVFRNPGQCAKEVERFIRRASG